ncbi:MAG: N-acetyltransferase [Nitrospinae bacterium]|nr:N-acetyltransferase [Nitrospinota bacterium]
MPENFTLRKAKLYDTKQIAALLKFYTSKGIILGRNEADISENIREFTVCEVKGEITGVVSLAIFWENLAEIRSLAINPELHRHGFGSALVKYSIQEAKELGCKKVFTLTYEDVFFKKLGFEETDKHLFSQKVWAECTKCMKFPDCDEIALSLSI